VQIGRQNFRERRQWWWDADLDAVRLYFNRKNFYFETAFAQELGYASTEFDKYDPEEEGVRRVLGQASWRRQKDHRLDLFFLRHNDVSPRHRVNQFVPWQTQLPWHPTFTLSYALGSGGNAEGEDRSFRQTGLQENNNKFNGVDRFRYYGELLRPELSNLRLITAAAGLRFWHASSIEFLYHRYRQYQPADFLRGARLKADPEGVDPALGEEWNVVIGLEELQRLEIEIVGGMFRAGKAYGGLAGEVAYNAILKMDFNF
jgi:hypothetical protein